MKEFFKTIYSATYKRDFYNQVPALSMKQCYFYFFKVIFLMALLATIGFSFWTLSPTIKSFKRISTIIVRDFPSDLVLNVENGIASSTPPTYELAISDSLKAEALKKGDADYLTKNLLVVNTNTNFTDINESLSHDTLIYFTKDKMVVRDGEQARVLPLDQMKDMKISKESIAGYISDLMPKMKYFAPLIAFGLLVTQIVGGGITYLIICLASAFVLWIIYRLKKRNIWFRNIFKISLFMATPVILVDGILMLALNTVFPVLPAVIVICVLWFAYTKGIEFEKFQNVMVPEVVKK